MTANPIRSAYLFGAHWHVPNSRPLAFLVERPLSCRALGVSPHDEGFRPLRMIRLAIALLLVLSLYAVGVTAAVFLPDMPPPC